MKEWLKLLSIIALLVTSSVLTWRYFYGIEVIPEEHRIDEEPFLKHRRTWQYKFENPIVQGYEVTPQDKLFPSQKSAFMDFCQVRYGIDDIESCYREICKGTITTTDGCEPYSASHRAGREKVPSSERR